MLRSPASRAATGILFLGAIFCATQVPAAPHESVPTLAGPVKYARAWHEGIEHVQHGEYTEAEQLLRQLAQTSARPDAAQKWVETWLEAEQHRIGLNRVDYDDYVARTNKWLAKADLNRALKWAYYAMLNADDQDAFKGLDWVVTLRDDALTEAADLRDQTEWRAAHELYYGLSLIFEDDKFIDQLRQECLEHARLEEIYKAEREWQEPLEGIQASMVDDALWRIDQKYVEQADFLKLTEAAYREMLLLAESPVLREQFPTLTGERGADFVSRVRVNLDRMRKQRSLNHRDARRYFAKITDINRETARLPEALIVREYMNAALSKLDDFSSMIWPSDFREFEKHTRGDFIGVGIQIRNKYNPDIDDTEIMVVSPLEDTPAYRAGIIADDIITKVNDESLVGIPVTKAVDIITGPLGTNVTLSIRRDTEDGDEDLTFKLTREVVEIVSVKGWQRRSDDEQAWNFMLDEDMGIAYARINSFQDKTVNQLARALSEARASGMKGLILDLRFNPGGLLKSAVQMAELFLGDGERIVSTRGLHSSEWAVDSEMSGPFKDLPLIVLINESSASASEIVSGAIKDHKRGLVIGERSFGKFSVQNLIPLVNSEAHLKLTTARYYLPSGKSLHREQGAKSWGVEPDLAIPLVPKEYSQIIYMRRDADVIGTSRISAADEASELFKGKEEKDEEDEKEPAEDGDKVADGEKVAEEEKEKPDPNNHPRRDPQLQTALLVMRMHLLGAEPIQMADLAPSPVAPNTPITAAGVKNE